MKPLSKRFASLQAPFLIHFDVDVMNFVDFPIADVPLINAGLTFADTMASLRVFASSPHFAGLVITEINPDHMEEDGSTARTFRKAPRSSAVIDTIADIHLPQSPMASIKSCPRWVTALIALISSRSNSKSNTRALSARCSATPSRAPAITPATAG